MRRLADFFKGKFVRDTIILQAGDTLTLVLAFVTSVLIARQLGPDGYGVYALVFSLFGLLSFTGDLGVTPATVTQLSEALAHRDRELAAEYCGYFVKLTAVLGVCLLVIGFIAGPLVADALYHRPEIGLLAGLLLADMLLGIPRNVARVAWQASRQMGHLSAFEAGRAAARLVFIGLALFLGLGVKGIVLAELASAVLSSLAAWPLFSRLKLNAPEVFPSWSETLAQAKRVPLGKHFGFGFKIVLDRNVVRILEVAPFLILGRLAPTAQVGYLRLAWGAINLPLNLLKGIANNLSARLPQLWAKGDSAGFWRVYLLTSLAGGAISIAAVGIFILLAPWLVKLFYGADFLPSLPYIRIMAVGAAASGFFAGIGALYRSVHRVGLVMAANLIQLAIYLPVCYLLIRAFETAGGAAFVSGRLIALNVVAFGLAILFLRSR